MIARTSRLQTSLDPSGPARRAVARRPVAAPTRVSLGLALACLAVGVVLHQGFGGSSSPAASSVRTHAAPHAGLLSLPAAAQARISAALGGDQAAYRIDGLVARNPAQRLSARFGRSGVSITAGSVRFAISLKGFGRGGTPWALAPISPVASADRIRYTRGSLSEWWANGPLGLEQGFDIARRPAGAGALTLSLAVSAGARLELDHGALSLPGGLRYGGVHAADARGRPLPAWLQLHGRRVLLRVDDRGAHYPLHVDPYVQQAAELTSTDAAAEDNLGYSVAVSGNTAVVGAPHQKYPQPHQPGTDTDPGSVYVFQLGAGGWAQTAKLTAPDGPADGLGWAVAISETGETIVAGAPGPASVSNPCNSTEGNLDPGQAFVYTMPSGGWKSTTTPTAELKASDGCPGAGLGWSVAVSGSTIVASAPFAPTTGGPTAGHPPTPGQGVAYEYTMPNTGGWKTTSQTAELTAGNPSGADVHLGWSVAVSGEAIVAGTPLQAVGAAGEAGAAYVFAKPAGAWTSTEAPTAELSASDPDPGSDQLGTSVAISGNTIVAGAPVHSTGSAASQFEAGAAYVYVRTGAWTSKTQTAELAASDRSGTLGSSVAISGTTVIAGAPNYQACEHTGQGAAYAFTEPSGGWTSMTEPAKFTSSDGNTVDAFGTSIAVSGSTVLAGAPRHLAAAGPNPEAGAAYVFDNGAAPTLNCEGSEPGPVSNVPASTSGSTATSGSIAPSGSPTPAGTVAARLALVKSISGGRAKATVTLSCPATGGACAAVSLKAAVEEHLKRGKVKAITANSDEQARATTKQVSVASGGVTLMAGTTKTLALTLNATGRALLSKFGKLPAIVTVSSAGKTIHTATVTVQKAAKPRKKK